MKTEEEIKERDKKYKIRNADKIKENHKRWYNDNVDKILEKQKIYNDKNADKIKEKRDKKITCDCGCEVKYRYLKRHQQTDKHIKLMGEKNVNLT